MRNFTLAVLAVLAVLLLAAGSVTAHGNDENTAGQDDAPVDGSAADWATWMEQRMTEHMGANAAAQMQERMGMSYQEMGEHMASRQDGPMMDGQMMGGSMSGMGCH